MFLIPQRPNVSRGPWQGGARRPRRVARSALLTAFAMLFFAPSSLWPFGQTVVYEAESQYHYVRVTQKAGVRTLYFRKGPTAARQSAVNIKDPLHLELEYTGIVFAGLAYIPEPKRALVVGLGGGAIPSLLRHHYPKLLIDVVEIDPMVVKVAKTYFFYRSKSPTRTIVCDGRQFVRRAARAGWRYDLVVLDAYTGSYIPPHMMTKEFLQQVACILTPQGCAVANIHTSSMLYDYEQRTYAAVFPQCHTFLGSRSMNAIVVGKNDPTPVTKEAMLARAKALQAQKQFQFDLNTVARMYADKKDWVAEGDILTDDFSPVNLLRMRGR